MVSIRALTVRLIMEWLTGHLRPKTDVVNMKTRLLLTKQHSIIVDKKRSLKLSKALLSFRVSRTKLKPRTLATPKSLSN